MTLTTVQSQQIILSKLNNLDPKQLQEVLNFIDFLEFKAQYSQTVSEETIKKPISFLESAKEFIGCIDEGPGDLATNKEYLQGFNS